MRFRVGKALFTVSVLFVCALPNVDGTAAAAEPVRIQNGCVRSPVGYSGDEVGYGVTASTAASRTPVSRTATRPVMRRANRPAAPLIPEEVPVPSAVWLVAIGFGCAGSALRRQPE